MAECRPTFVQKHMVVDVIQIRYEERFVEEFRRHASSHLTLDVYAQGVTPEKRMAGHSRRGNGNCSQRTVVKF